MDLDFDISRRLPLFCNAEVGGSGPPGILFSRKH